MMILSILCCIVGIISMFLISTFYIPWSVHKGQVSDFTPQNIKGNFNDFKREFSKIHWERSDDHKNSLFEIGRYRIIDESESQIHAGIIEFNGVGMKLDFISYLRLRWFMKDMDKIPLTISLRREETLDKLLK